MKTASKPKVTGRPQGDVKVSWPEARYQASKAKYAIAKAIDPGMSHRTRGSESGCHRLTTHSARTQQEAHMRVAGLLKIWPLKIKNARSR